MALLTSVICQKVSGILQGLKEEFDFYFGICTFITESLFIK